MELANLFKTFLESQGYNAISFIDPVLTLDYFNQTSDTHSLILTDFRMPGICGIDLAKKIRQINNKIKIFLMTAFETEGLKDSEDFKITKIDRLLQKPIRFSDLREMINDALKN